MGAWAATGALAGPGGRVRVVSPDARVPDLLEALASALHGGPALLPVPGGAPGAAVRAAAGIDGHPDHPLSGSTVLLLPTSGSTGTPKVVELSAGALRASAEGTAAVLGEGARWLLALPLVHVAAWQVLVRSVLAGTEPVVLGAGRFTAAAFADAVEGMGAATGGRRATSLVPTQLARVVAEPRARAAAASLDAVLVGGAACPAPLLAAAREAGVRAVTTYGSTETAGGCVYDGVPLPGVRVRLEDGRVLLAGPVLATRYRGGVGTSGPAAAVDPFVQRGPARWYATPDTGHLEGGRLVVTGRADDVVVTGGVNVAPAAVEDVVAALPGVAQVLVVGVPDEQWGAAVTALVVPDGRAPAPAPDAVRAAVRERLGPAAAPRRVLVVADVPVRALGKPDRRAATALAVAAVAVDPCAGLG